MANHACHPSTLEVEAKRFRNSSPSSSTWQDLGQPGLIETPSLHKKSPNTQRCYRCPHFTEDRGTERSVSQSGGWKDVEQDLKPGRQLLPSLGSCKPLLSNTRPSIPPCLVPSLSAPCPPRYALNGEPDQAPVLNPNGSEDQSMTSCHLTLGYLTKCQPLIHTALWSFVCHLCWGSDLVISGLWAGNHIHPQELPQVPRALRKMIGGATSQNLCFGTICPKPLPILPPWLSQAPSFCVQMEALLLHSHSQVNCSLFSGEETLWKTCQRAHIHPAVDLLLSSPFPEALIFCFAK